MVSGFIKTSDGAYIYYEVEGEGRPIMLIHGWGCSGRYYKRNVEGLKDRYMVVTMDLRGHGRSSKNSDGYYIDRLAKDIHEVIEYLGLKDVLLMGWSMGGPTMLSYWKQFGKDHGHLAGLGLIDMTPYPMSDGEWNSHGLRDHNAEGFNAFEKSILKDHEGFIHGFMSKIFQDGKIPDGLDWAYNDMMALPPYLGIALYSDYVYSDYTDVLPTITVPTLVLSSNSGIFPKSLEQGKWIASQIPKGEFVPFETGGHMLMWTEADKFNKVVAEFAARL
ncbi:MAG: alpha/beta fold hydrolase [Succiniclasticum sp.]|jgi:non-heme chloroperoxidase